MKGGFFLSAHEQSSNTFLSEVTMNILYANLLGKKIMLKWGLVEDPNPPPYPHPEYRGDMAGGKGGEMRTVGDCRCLCRTYY